MEAIARARANGACILAVRDAHHMGRIGTYGEMAARLHSRCAELIALKLRADYRANENLRAGASLYAASGLYKEKITDDIAVVRLSFQLPKKKLKTTDELK